MGYSNFNFTKKNAKVMFRTYILHFTTFAKFFRSILSSLVEHSLLTFVTSTHLQNHQMSANHVILIRKQYF